MKRTIQIIGILAVAAMLMSATMALAAQEPGALLHSSGGFQAAGEPTVDPTATPVAPYPDVVINAIADYFGVSSDEVRQLYDSGIGLGLIVHLYALSEELGKTPQQMLMEKEASGLGWGQFIGLGQMDDKETGKEARRSVTVGSIMSELMGGTTNPEGTPVQARDQLRDQERTQLREADQHPDDTPVQEQAQQQTQAQTQTQEQNREQVNSSGAGQGSNDGGNGNSGGKGGGNSGGGGSSGGGGGKGKNK